jgi:RNase P/RNase MRP subunit POP5
MAKIKRLKLKPSARDKRRYFIVDSSNDESLKKNILDYIGILGMAKADYKTVKKSKGKIIGSCLREELNNVRAGLALAGISIEKVSGTLKGLGA